VSGEYILEPHDWPAMPAAHHRFLERAIPKFRADARLAGVAAGGSFISSRLDEHSDLDLVVISGPDVAADVLRDGAEIAGTLGPLLAAFVGDHVGRARRQRLSARVSACRMPSVRRRVAPTRC
jgi:predicted nucleotidyltransferase